MYRYVHVEDFYICEAASLTFWRTVACILPRNFHMVLFTLGFFTWFVNLENTYVTAIV